MIGEVNCSGSVHVVFIKKNLHLPRIQKLHPALYVIAKNVCESSTSFSLRTQTEFRRNDAINIIAPNLIKLTPIRY